MKPSSLILFTNSKFTSPQNVIINYKWFSPRARTKKKANNSESKLTYTQNF